MPKNAKNKQYSPIQWVIFSRKVNEFQFDIFMKIYLSPGFISFNSDVKYGGMFHRWVALFHKKILRQNGETNLKIIEFS